MTNVSSTKRALVSSVVALIICFTILLGTTFAWFSDDAKSVGNVIKTGTLDVTMEWLDGSAAPTDNAAWADAEDGAIFHSSVWEPGYVMARHIKIENKGTLAFKYQLRIVADGKISKLADVIDVYYLDPAAAVTDADLSDENKLGTLSEALLGLASDESTARGKLEAGENHTVTVALKMQETAGNEYQDIDLGAAFDIVLYATQTENENGFDETLGGAWLPSVTWDGTADTSWYNEEATEFTISTAEALAGLAKLVNEGNSFAGKTVKLGNDVDLYCEDENGNPKSFKPIGDESPFEGSFDGQGHTIENLYQSGWDFGYEWGSYGSIGMFGEVKNAAVKNLTVKGATAQIEGGDIGGITGSASGTCVFENITVEDSDFGTYNNGIGGIIGWSGAGEYTFKNITIAEDVVLGGLWGSFDSSVGGVVGQAEPGAAYRFENVDVACRLDVYNDVTAAYKYYLYRMCGMLIGRLEETTTIDGRNYPDMSKYDITCKDVTVTYGEWADYHYCVVEGKTAWRVEPGFTYGGVPADHDHTTCAVCCNMLLPFDSLFGGDQLGVNGLTAYDGVDVFYNNASKKENANANTN